MKKIIIIIAILALCSFVFVGCVTTNGNENTYTTLNELCAFDYSIVNLSVETTYNGVTLTNTFNAIKRINETEVNYSIQKMATIDVDENGNYVIPDNTIVTESGTAKVVDGNVVEGNANIPIPQLESILLQFKAEYFTNVNNYTEGNLNVFSATVSNVKGFTDNQDFDGTNMTVVAKYDYNLSELVLNYTTANGATVVVTYNLM